MNKLLIVVSSMSFGGAEIQTLELANGLVLKGYDIDIVVLDHRDGVKERADKKIRFHFMNKNGYLDFHAISKIRNLIKQNRPNLIFCVDMYPTMYVRFALLGMRKENKVITVLHSTLPRDDKEKFQRMYLTRIMRFADKIIFVSQNQMKYWKKKYDLRGMPCSYILNGIDIEKFSNFIQDENQKEELLSKIGFSKEDIIIGNCSRFRIEKNHKDLIDVTRNLIDEGYKVKLLLIGDGDMIEQMKEQIKQLNLEKEVYITGHTDDIRPYMDLVDIFVLPSKSIETLSIAGIESMAMSKALVLSDIGGASELVENGVNGYLYPANSAKKLQESIEYILKAKNWKKMGKKSLEKAKKLFNKEQMIQKYDEHFKRTMRINPKINYLYRIDDINPAMDWKTFDKIMSVFKEGKVVPLLGLVPDNKDDFLKYGKEREDYYDIIKTMIENKEIDICQHGYTHEYTTVQKGVNQILYGMVSTSEFSNLPYEKQYDMIQKGKKILEQNGIENIDTWMAPSHTNDTNTLKALKALGFKYITDGVAVYPFFRYGLKFMPVQIFHPRKVFSFGTYTICLHLFDLDDNLIENIRQHIKSSDNIISFRDSLEIKHKWYHPFANLLYKMNRIAYNLGLRRVREFKQKLSKAK